MLILISSGDIGDNEPLENDSKLNPLAKDNEDLLPLLDALDGSVLSVFVDLSKIRFFSRFPEDPRFALPVNSPWFGHAASSVEQYIPKIEYPKSQFPLAPELHIFKIYGDSERI